MEEDNQSIRILVPAEKLASAVEKYLLPGLLRYLAAKEVEQREVDKKISKIKNRENN